MKKCSRCKKRNIHRRNKCKTCLSVDNKKSNDKRPRAIYVVSDIEGEEWKDIPRYVGYYMASSFGRIKSVKREYKTKNGSFAVQEKIRKLIPDNGYLKVNLYINGVESKEWVHRLIAETFIPNPYNKPRVNHKKGIKTDNRASELEWVTAKEDNDHAKNVLGHDYAKGIRHRGKTHVQSKRIAQINIQTNKIIKVWDCVSDVLRAKIASSASMCALGKLNTSGGYKWKYI